MSAKSTSPSTRPAPSYSAAGAITIVTKRELRENLTKKGMVITFVLGLVLSIASVLVISWFQGKADSPAVDSKPTLTNIAIIGEAPFDEQSANGLGFDIRAVSDEDAAREQLKDGDIRAVITPGDTEGTWKVITDDDTAVAERIIDAHTEQARADAITSQGGDPQIVNQASAAAAQSIQPESLEPFGTDVMINVIVTAAGLFLLIMAIFTFGASVAQSVIEEKSSRVIELILATTRPLHLLVGKILGAGLAGLIMIVGIAAAGMITARITGLIPDAEVPWSTILTVLIFFILGYTFFACLYATAGSLVSRMEDFNGAQMPVLVLAFAVMYIPMFGWQNLDSQFMTIASWIPPLSITIAPLQYAMGNFTFIQLALSAAVLLLGCVLVIYLASRIYPRNVLRMGARVSWKDALKRS